MFHWKLSIHASMLLETSKQGFCFWLIWTWNLCRTLGKLKSEKSKYSTKHSAQFLLPNISGVLCWNVHPPPHRRPAIPGSDLSLVLNSEFIKKKKKNRLYCCCRRSVLFISRSCNHSVFQKEWKIKQNKPRPIAPRQKEDKKTSVSLLNHFLVCVFLFLFCFLWLTEQAEKAKRLFRNFWEWTVGIWIRLTLHQEVPPTLLLKHVAKGGWNEVNLFSVHISSRSVFSEEHSSWIVFSNGWLCHARLALVAWERFSRFGAMRLFPCTETFF